MILADTSIIIGFLKYPTAAIRDRMLAEKVVICGIIQAEILHGAKNPSDFQRLKDALAGFDVIPIHEGAWIEAGELLMKLRSKGIRIPFQDAILAVVAVKNDILLWTSDRHFQVISNEDPRVKLIFEETNRS